MVLNGWGNGDAYGRVKMFAHGDENQDPLLAVTCQVDLYLASIR